MISKTEKNQLFCKKEKSNQIIQKIQQFHIKQGVNHTQMHQIFVNRRKFEKIQFTKAKKILSSRKVPYEKISNNFIESKNLVLSSEDQKNFIQKKQIGNIQQIFSQKNKLHNTNEILIEKLQNQQIKIYSTAKEKSHSLDPYFDLTTFNHKVKRQEDMLKELKGYIKLSKDLYKGLEPISLSYIHIPKYFVEKHFEKDKKLEQILQKQKDNLFQSESERVAKSYIPFKGLLLAKKFALEKGKIFKQRKKVFTKENNINSIKQGNHKEMIQSINNLIGYETQKKKQQNNNNFDISHKRQIQQHLHSYSPGFISEMGNKKYNNLTVPENRSKSYNITKWLNNANQNCQKEIIQNQQSTIQNTLKKLKHLEHKIDKIQSYKMNNDVIQRLFRSQTPIKLNSSSQIQASHETFDNCEISPHKKQDRIPSFSLSPLRRASTFANSERQQRISIFLNKHRKLFLMSNSKDEELKLQSKKIDEKSHASSSFKKRLSYLLKTEYSEQELNNKFENPVFKEKVQKQIICSTQHELEKQIKRFKDIQKPLPQQMNLQLEQMFENQVETENVINYMILQSQLTNGMNKPQDFQHQMYVEMPNEQNVNKEKQKYEPTLLTIFNNNNKINIYSAKFTNYFNQKIHQQQIKYQKIIKEKNKTLALLTKSIDMSQYQSDINIIQQQGDEQMSFQKNVTFAKSNEIQ